MRGALKGIYASPNGGIQKPAIVRARGIADHGVEGDACARHKRAPKNALCLYSAEFYGELNAEGIAVKGGDFAENFLLSGVDFRNVRIGDVFRVGKDALMEISMVPLALRKSPSPKKMAVCRWAAIGRPKRERAARRRKDARERPIKPPLD